MYNEIYIIIGLCVFAFLLGVRLKKKFSAPVISKPIPKSQRSKQSRLTQQAPKPKREKLKHVFIWIQVVLIFCLIVFMIPALTRDVAVADGVYNTNLFLRILIVGLALWTLFLGVNKLLKRKTEKK